jgi:two-component system, LytTR family, response regulator
MIKTILVDDELRLLSGLNKMLELHCPQLTISALCQSAEDAIEKIKAQQPNLVFLDISMPVKTAFELLSELHPIDFEIIFVTAHHQYMEQAFKFSAVDYLLKPVDEDELINAVSRAIKRIHDHNFHYSMSTFLYNLQKKPGQYDMKLCIPILKGFEVFDLPEVIYCEAEGAYTNFHLTSGRKVCASKPLIDYELLLQDKAFFRIHKSFLINANHIKQYFKGEGGTVMMSNGNEIEVSRRKKEQFLAGIKEQFKH